MAIMTYHFTGNPAAFLKDLRRFLRMPLETLPFKGNCEMINI